jgi:hypothetical protein
VAFRNQFINPATGSTYTWAANHLTEEASAVTREINHLQPVAAGWAETSPMLQQGRQTPRKLRLGGTTGDDYQHYIFLTIVRLCKTQTVLFHHGPDNVTVEVLVTSYESRRVAVVSAARGGLHVYKYTMELEEVT